MIFGNIMLAVSLTAAIFAINFEDCNSRRTDDANAKSKAISGSFSGELPKTPGFLKLDLKSDGSATLLNVITIHNPPFEAERLAAKLRANENGALCFEPKPKTIEPCLIAADEQEVTVKLVSENVELKLVRDKK